MARSLRNITLVGVDCGDITRLKLAADICQKNFEFGAVKLLSSIPDLDPRVVAIAPVTSKEEYSHFCIRWLADFVDTDFALVIQYDGFILNPDAWDDEFLSYDYIGAPWWYTDGMNVGNGGFSLRSKKLLVLLKSLASITQYHPEDHHICRTYRTELERLGIRFAHEELAARFSIEGISKGKNLKSDNRWDGEFGFHGLQKTDISKWLKAHPEHTTIKNEIKLKYRTWHWLLRQRRGLS